MPVYICLMRSINVGGTKSIKMAELRDLFASIGLADAKTYLQTGNVIFKSDLDSDALLKKIDTAIEDAYGFHVDMMLLTVEDLKAAIEEAPFTPEQLDDPKKTTFVFLDQKPAKAHMEKLLAAYTGPETIYPDGRHLYVFYAEGVGRSKLTNALMERHLKVVTTARNGNTTLKVLAMAEDMAAQT